MHLKVFLKLKKNLKTLSSGQIKKNKKPLGWVFLEKTGFFPTLPVIADVAGWCGSVAAADVVECCGSVAAVSLPPPRAGG
jgi:hypothetical protein